MVKALTFKGDKKAKKRKRIDTEEKFGNEGKTSKNNQITATNVEKRDVTNEASEDDSWISAESTEDILGPIIIILPSEPPSCIACDSIGKVFAITLENIIDKNPTTAEPHDVRQVWVANRVAGTETFSVKGHNGKYLGCDKYGLLSSCAEAVSPLESFLLLPTTSTPGTFQIQTLRGTYLTLQPCTTSSSSKPLITMNNNTASTSLEIRGDSEDITFNTTFRIRMQARFKPKYKASKQEKAREKISRKEIEDAVGRRLDDDEIHKLKRARREGNYHETLLLIKVKNKHDKYS